MGRRCSYGNTLAAAFAASLMLAAGSCRAEDAAQPVNLPEDLLLSATQDADLYAKAWSAETVVDFKDTTLEAVFAALAERSGVKIEMTPEARKFCVAFEKGKCFGRGGLWMVPAGDPAAKHFLGEVRALSLNARLGTFQVRLGPGSAVQELTVRGKVPVAALLRSVPTWLDPKLAASFRAGAIHLGTREELAKEIVVTRSYQLAEGWGCVREGSYNGELLRFRLGILDAAAKYLDVLRENIASEAFRAAAFEGKEYKGFHAQLLARHPEMRIAWNPETRALTLAATPYVLDQFQQYGLEKLNGKSPETYAREAAAGREARMKELAQDTWAAVDEARRKSLRAVVAKLDDEAFEAREAAAEALKKEGAAALHALLEAKPKSEELRERARQLALRLYAEAEVRRVRAAADAYIPVGLAWDYAGAYKHWTPERRAIVDGWRAEFDAVLKVARTDPDVMKSVRMRWSIPEDVPDNKVTFELAKRSSAYVGSAKDLAIDAVVLCGAKAVVRFHYTENFEDDDTKRVRTESLTLRCCQGQWKVGLPEPITEAEAITWDPEHGIYGGPVQRKKDDAVQLLPNGIAGFASAYATSFSFFDY